MRPATLLTAAVAALLLAPAAASAQTAPAPVPALTMMAAAVPCADIEAQIAFYTKGLGMTLRGRTPMGPVIEGALSFPGDGPNLILMCPAKPGAPIVPRTMANRIILAVPNLKALEARLNAAGYKLSGKINEMAQYHVSVAQMEDPDGNHIELVQRGP